MILIIIKTWIETETDGQHGSDSYPYVIKKLDAKCAVNSTLD